MPSSSLLPRTVLRFDLRQPHQSPELARESWSLVVEMAAWADAAGFDTLVITERHEGGDGLVSPMVLAGAVAGRTRSLAITIDGLVVPLHDPIRLAEDLAVLDVLSHGRLSIIATTGDHPREYWLFGRDWSTRAARMDECLDVLVAAWSGASFTYQGDQVRVGPRPRQQPHPLLFVAGPHTADAERAARFGSGFCPTRDDPALVTTYRDACEAAGRRPGYVITPTGRDVVFLADDPDEMWAACGEQLLVDARDTAGAVPTVAALRDRGPYRIITPTECVELAHDLGPQGTLTFSPLCGGIDPSFGWRSLELFAHQVMPTLRPR